jgi:centriolar protein POC1
MKVNSLIGHNNPIYAAIWHPLKDLFYTAGNDKGIVEWDHETQTFIRLFKPLKATVYSLEIITENNTLIAGCNNGDICFFDLESCQLIQTLNAHSAVFNLKYIPQKKELIASTDKGIMIIINPFEQKIIHQFQSGDQKIRSFAIHQSLNLLAAASNDETIRIYQLDDFWLLHEFKGHDLGVGAIAFSPSGQTLITGGRDAHLKVWDTKSWENKISFAAHLFAIYKIAFHPFLPYIATASRDKSIKIWRSDDYTLFKNLSLDKLEEGHKLSINDIFWSSNGKQLLSVSDDKTVKVWTFDGF